MMVKRIILDLCGGTGAWSNPYREHSDMYDVYNITLPDYDILKTDFTSEMIIIFSGNAKQLEIDRTYIYGILAAPPCAMFSFARTTAKTKRDLKQGMETVIACLKIIWECQYQGVLKFWALENPRGLLRKFLGVPIFTFEQWEFGERGIKPTDIWGCFNLPKKQVFIRPEGLSKKWPNGKINAIGWSKSAERRAATPAGFAQAFFEANQ